MVNCRRPWLLVGTLIPKFVKRTGARKAEDESGLNESRGSYGWALRELIFELGKNSRLPKPASTFNLLKREVSKI